MKNHERYLLRGLTPQGEWKIGPNIMWDDGRPHIFPATDAFDSPQFYEVLPETVGQWTGLVDTQGEKIWEGDVRLVPIHVEVDTFKEASYTETDEKGIRTFINCDPKPCVVVRNPKDGGWMYQHESGKTKPFWIDPGKTELVGNIHQSPELCEG